MAKSILQNFEVNLTNSIFELFYVFINHLCRKIYNESRFLQQFDSLPKTYVSVFQTVEKTLKATFLYSQGISFVKI